MPRVASILIRPTLKPSYHIWMRGDSGSKGILRPFASKPPQAIRLTAPSAVSTRLETFKPRRFSGSCRRQDDNIVDTGNISDAPTTLIRKQAYRASKRTRARRIHADRKAKPPLLRLGVMTSTQLQLTEREELFRQCLLSCRDSMTSTPGMKDLVLRWTGGWVRDKLLGVRSHDIDVALSTMTGMQFGEALQSFMAEHESEYEELAQKQGFAADIKGLHKIEANPEKSKHLETITTRMFGIDVDFVNLRKEVYDDSSRNPQVEFGTAEEDALRRDATVNALFFNLDTQEVEDFTQQGLTDMKNGIIRTPLAPYQTFKDDPLRVLRLIRFSCRLGYGIEESALQAMADPKIHKALSTKISRERVGIEVHKIFQGPNAYVGLTLINDLGLYPNVFASPGSSAPPNRDAVQSAYDATRYILEQEEDNFSARYLGQLTWLLASYVPWYSQGRTIAVKEARNAIKSNNKLTGALGDAITFRPLIQQGINVVNKGTATRGIIGMIVRTSKGLWRPHLLYSLLCDMVDNDFEEQLTRYQKFSDYVQEQNLQDAHLADKDLVLKGNEIQDALGERKAGPWLKSAVDMVVEWQFDNEATATKENAIEMIRARRGDLGLD